MSHPTGMGAATGMHYQNVAAQMGAYLNNNSPSPRLQPASGHFHQHQYSRTPAFASHGVSSVGNYLGMDVVTNDVGGFARMFVQNLLR